MAIGILLPPPPSQRLRLTRAAGTVFARRTQLLRTGLLRLARCTRIVWRRLVSTAQDVVRMRARARQRQRAQFHQFEQHYENLIDVLCAAAHEGNRPDRQEIYARERTWMRSHYATIARRLRHYWNTAIDRDTDPFLALFCREDLSEAIELPTAIDDIMRSRSALENYRCELPPATR